MNLNRLRVFRYVYERQSVSEAARALSLTQPPVSRMLRAYEGEVGLRLFTRDRGRLVPTPEADALYRDAMAVFDGLERLERTSRNLRAGRCERLSVVASLSISYALLAPALKRFRQQYPDIPIDVSTGTLRHQLYALERGDVDLSLTFNAPSAPDIKSVTLGRGTFVVVLPIDHPLARQSSVGLSDLAPYPVLAGMRDSPLPVDSVPGLLTDGGQGAAGITVRSTVLAAALTSVGLGIALIDQFSAVAFPRNDISVRPLSQPILFEIQALMRSQHRLSSAQEYFLEDIEAEIRQAGEAQLPLQ